ncbi:MAG: hypothetical protein RLZZ164_334 [Actinomycetota bacterium]
MKKLLAPALALLVVVSATVPASASTPFASTAAFIASKFVNGQYIEGFTKGKPDWGFSVEALLQLRGAGYTDTGLAKAISYNLKSRTNLGTATSKRGFLYAPDGAFLVGRAGEALFAERVFGLQSSAVAKSILTRVKAAVSKTGEIKNAAGNTFTYSWAALGLNAMGERALARTICAKLLTFARSDNGFGTDLTADTTASTPDATGIALMAFAATKSVTSKVATIGRLLFVNAVDHNHWESWGDVDVNGTAYASMGLTAVNQGAYAFQAFLAGRIGSDGGITTPWSNGAGDTYATVQGYLALRGLSYLSLIKG